MQPPAAARPPGPLSAAAGAANATLRTAAASSARRMFFALILLVLPVMVFPFRLWPDGQCQGENHGRSGSLRGPCEIGGPRRRSRGRKHEERKRDRRDARAEVRDDLPDPQQVEVAVVAERALVVWCVHRNLAELKGRSGCEPREDRAPSPTAKSAGEGASGIGANYGHRRRCGSSERSLAASGAGSREAMPSGRSLPTTTA